MVINYLDRYLPIELTDKIYKLHHNSVMRDICEIINHKCVFTIYYEDMVRPRMSWLVCENQNYYTVLDPDQMGIINICDDNVLLNGDDVLQM